MNDEKTKGIKYNKNIVCQIDSNNKKYNLTVSNNDSIIFFQVEEINSLPIQDFNLHLNLEQIGKVNKFFLQFDNLNEISDSIKNIIDSKSIKIEKKDKEIILTFVNPINMKEFNLSIPLKEKDIKAEIASLNSYMLQLNEKIENLTEKVNYLENKIKEIIDNSFMFSKSTIIRKDEQDLILGWMEKKPKNFKLLLDSNIDGDSNSTFCNKCCQKGPIIVFIKTNNGYRFGGYTSQFWPSQGYGKDEKSFLFSLDLKNKYKCIAKEWAIYTWTNSYFSFGNNIYIYNMCTQNESSYLREPLSYDIPKNYELNGGKNKFVVKSYEVYQVEY